MKEWSNPAMTSTALPLSVICSGYASIFPLNKKKLDIFWERNVQKYEIFNNSTTNFCQNVFIGPLGNLSGTLIFHM